MIQRLRGSHRRGATAVELAFICPVVLFLFFALAVGAMGVFRYQEVAHLARQGARYAATHGATYDAEGADTRSGVPAISTSGQMRDYLLPQTTLLDPNSLTVNLSYTAGFTPPNIPLGSDPDPNLIPPGSRVIRNNVRVTVSYQWMPEMYLIGPITLTSTSEMPMSY
jgi:TadE-like protein